MAVIKYSVKENKTLGTHSYYAQAVSFSTLEFQDLADEVVEGLGITPELVNTILTRYMRVAKRNVLRGHRVKFGDLLTIYPQISCSVKDEVDDNGNIIKVATADMLNVASAKGSIGATISQAVQQSFAQSVSWKRSNETTSDDGGDPEGEGGGSSSGGDSQPTTTGYALTITKSGSGTASVTSGGSAVNSGASLSADAEVEISVTPAEGQIPTALLNGSNISLTESDGTYFGTFTMPAQASTLAINTGTEGSEEGDQN